MEEWKGKWQNAKLLLRNLFLQNWHYFWTRNHPRLKEGGYNPNLGWVCLVTADTSEKESNCQPLLICYLYPLYCEPSGLDIKATAGFLINNFICYPISPNGWIYLFIQVHSTFWRKCVSLCDQCGFTRINEPLWRSKVCVLHFWLYTKILKLLSWYDSLVDELFSLRIANRAVQIKLPLSYI